MFVTAEADATLFKTAKDYRVEKIRLALDLQPSLPISKLAQMVQLQPSWLGELFQRQTGVTISSYSLEVRLQRAGKLLIATPLSVKQVRNEIGIPDGSNFVRYFKSRFAMTPSEYRKAFQPRLDQQNHV